MPGKELGRDDFARFQTGCLEWRIGSHTVDVRRSCRKITPSICGVVQHQSGTDFWNVSAKGRLLPESDADMVIWDPERHVEYEVRVAHHRTDYNLYEGWELVGYPEKVFLRGKLIVDGERWLGGAGQGEFIARNEGEVL